MTVKKRIISLVVAVFMVLAMIPMASQEAYADDTFNMADGTILLGNTVTKDLSSYTSSPIKWAALDEDFGYVNYDAHKVEIQANLEFWNFGRSGRLHVEFQNGKVMESELITVKLDIGQLEFFESVPDLTYTGKAVKHKKLKFTFGPEPAQAVLGEDFTVTYKNNVKVGKATVILKGKKYLVGSKTMTFNILPKGTTAKAPKKGKKSFTARWARQKAKMNKARITGYQVQYSTDKKFKTGVKNKYVKGYKKTSKKITGLKKKTIYYVRIRTYMKVSGKYYYSTWSKVKSVKTK